MRHIACLGLLLLVTSACAHIPDHIRVELDGSTIEVTKKSPVSPVSDDD